MKCGGKESTLGAHASTRGALPKTTETAAWPLQVFAAYTQKPSVGLLIGSKQLAFVEG